MAGTHDVADFFIVFDKFPIEKSHLPSLVCPRFCNAFPLDGPTCHLRLGKTSEQGNERLANLRSRSDLHDFERLASVFSDSMKLTR